MVDATPPSPKRMDFTMSPLGTMVIMTGHSAPISAYEASLPPFATTSATASLLRSAQTTSTPALRRFFAMGLPIIPRPINPAFISFPFLSHIRENLYHDSSLLSFPVVRSHVLCIFRQPLLCSGQTPFQFGIPVYRFDDFIVQYTGIPVKKVLFSTFHKIISDNL